MLKAPVACGIVRLGAAKLRSNRYLVLTHSPKPGIRLKMFL